MKIPIRHMSFARKWCIAFAHRLEPERIFVILTAYLDESGTHDGYHYQAGSSGLEHPPLRRAEIKRSPNDAGQSSA